MATKKDSFLNMVLALFMVTFFSAAILGFVYNITNAPIAKAADKTQESAIKAILPEFKTLGKSQIIVPEGGGENLEFFPAYNKSKKLVGMAVKTSTMNGFSGLIEMMVGFQPDGNIFGYQILKHQETPGLGARMTTWFKDINHPKRNIIGKNPGKINFTVNKDGGDIDAMTASTITSRAFLEAVKRAYKEYMASSFAVNKDSNLKGGKQ